MNNQTDNHPVLIYGQAASGKTTIIGDIIEYLGRPCHLYTCEHWKAVQPLVDRGLIEAWRINTSEHPFEAVKFAADGFWPAPDGALKFDPSPITIYEGLATFSNFLAGNDSDGGLASRNGRNETVNPSNSKDGPIRVTDGSTTVGKVSRSDYGFVQDTMQSIVRRSQKRPGITIWTSHDDEVDETVNGQKTGRTVIGPEVFGGKLTTLISREFVDVWRVVRVPVVQNGRAFIERRLYIKTHVDPISGSALATARNSAPIGRQAELPDYFLLTDAQRPGLPRSGAAKVVVEAIGL